jgi:hypothetical protein
VGGASGKHNKYHVVGRAALRLCDSKPAEAGWSHGAQRDGAPARTIAHTADTRACYRTERGRDCELHLRPACEIGVDLLTRARPVLHMQPLRLHRRARRSLVGILLLAVLARGLIPAGYMPATGMGFGLQLCDAGLSHHPPQHGGPGPRGAPHVEHCVFGNAPLPGPAPHGIVVVAPPAPVAALSFPAKPLRVSVRLLRTQQPRAPPLPV